MRIIENSNEFRDNIRFELYKILSFESNNYTNNDTNNYVNIEMNKVSQKDDSLKDYNKTLNSCQRMAYNLEVSIYNYVIKESNNLKVHKKWDNPYFVELYVNRLRSIYMNLKSDKFKNDIINKNIQIDKLANMNHHELNPERWKLSIEKKIKRDTLKYERKMEAATDTFTCRKCKSKECNYYQMQTRSADEPMTTFVSCINCGNRWKC